VYSIREQGPTANLPISLSMLSHLPLSGGTNFAFSSICSGF
jgi:hypothetical protein